MQSSSSLQLPLGQERNHPIQSIKILRLMGSGEGGAVCWYCGKVVATSTCLVVAAMEGIEGIGFAVSTAGTGGYEWHGTGRERKKSVTVKDLSRSPLLISVVESTVVVITSAVEVDERR